MAYKPAPVISKYYDMIKRDGALRVARLHPDDETKSTVILPLARLAYANLHQPDEEGAKKGYGNKKTGEPYFKATLLFPKEADLKVLREVAEAVWKRSGEVVPYNKRLLRLVSADTADDFNKAIPNGLPEDGLFIDTKTTRQPSLLVYKSIDGKLKQYPAPEGSCVSGNWAVAIVTVLRYPGGQNYKPGLMLSLQTVIAYMKDEPLGGFVTHDADKAMSGMEAPPEDWDDESSDSSFDDIPY